MIKHAILLILICLLHPGATCQDSSGALEKKPTVTVAHQQDAHVISALLTKLRANGRTGRLYYGGLCVAPDGLDIAPLPISDADVKNSRNWQEFRNALLVRGTASVEVEEKAGSAIRIRIGNASRGVLGIRIKSIALSEKAQYDPRVAVREILSSQDVRTGLIKSHAKSMIQLGGLVSISGSGRPHLPDMLQNATVDEAFDQILEAFGGLIVYGECTQSNGNTLFNVSFD